jgi:hypothetical protein
VARRPIRERLNIAADLLTKDGERLEAEERHQDAAEHFEAAADIRAVLAPGGWSMLRSAAGTAPSSSNLAVQMGSKLKASLEVAAREFDMSLSSIAAEGLRAAARGEFLPPRAHPGEGPRTNLNVRIPDDVLRELGEGRLAELSAEAGYRISKANIVTAWLADELGVDRPVGSDPASSATLRVVAEKRLIDYWRLPETRPEGMSLTDVVEEGIRDFVAGRWVPEVPEWLAVSERPREGGHWASAGTVSSAGEPVERTKLTLKIDPELLRGLRDRAAALSDESPFHPGMIVISLLKDRLGEPAE